jgi:hypothetical protein
MQIYTVPSFLEFTLSQDPRIPYRAPEFPPMPPDALFVLAERRRAQKSIVAVVCAQKP